ncbi:hypothetical protein LX97_03376 [Nonlabens dokdonensis]|jgi:hypothetical protein|uniref:Uncharacterized protein n=2 Tax=Nonlabens dokdonensis TaxID=328515 RepID=L7W5R3_NONDD|nr:hypothetical protein [Nonlabens dokdonensis]AGC77010.1 hypothetical protein DDD_1883 [Nonlabens dokdonensis DSW-6]PZX36911.1 hypothetical protein LX97_03376 [Nonlabens dokdonensis]
MQVKIFKNHYKLFQRLQNGALLGMLLCLLLFVFKNIEWKYSEVILMFAISNLVFFLFVSLIIQILKHRFIENKLIEISNVKEIVWNSHAVVSKEEINRKDLTYTKNYITLNNSKFEVHYKSAFLIGKHNLELVRLTNVKTPTIESNPSDILAFFQ